ncbi:hypothetical protein [Brevundimonas sp.]|uniref:hypothetical protein n=1 Tax=Brevundimonas sp. TaxID=1871086 RepID=UPI0035AFE5E1
MANEDPLWIARRDGQDWRDDDVQAAIDWLRGLAPAADMAARIEAQRQGLDAALAVWRDGGQAPPTDGQDPAAWWLLQGADFADGRRHSVPEEAARITPLLKRIGADLEILRGIPGAEERAGRLLTERRTSMDAGVYELLVALAWRRDGWTVEFVPEQRGGPATPDFLASRANRRWAVECKRLDRSTYAINEAAHGARLANPVHDLLREAGPPLVVETVYNVELQDVPDGYLVERVREALAEHRGGWADATAIGRLRPPDAAGLLQVMARDDVYYGSRRMIQLTAGALQPEWDYSFSGRWTPAEGRPFYATDLHHASVVGWTCRAPRALETKSGHFRRTLGRAERQLPTDRPGVVHIGIESTGEARVDRERFMANLIETWIYRPENRRFRWVNVNYFRSEVSLQRDTNWDFDETFAPLKIGRHRTPQPVPLQALVATDGPVERGAFF